MEAFSAIFTAFSLLLFLCFSSLSSAQISYDNRAIIINNQRKIILSGSIHYPRSTPGMWPDLINKAKLGGLNTIETYVFWNAHEPQYRQYDFTGNLDLVRFLKAIQAEGLYAILRIGPYVCAEWTFGGYPVWLKSLPGIQIRTNNTVYMNEMQTFTTKIVNMMNENYLFASQGGPIILAQLENEYGYVEGSYGAGGKQYSQWCANLAQSYKAGIPWIMCQQDDAPSPMISTCNGWYCDSWYPKNRAHVPKMWTENWTGWFKNWGGKHPHRTAEDVAFSVARFFERSGSMQNYYMYHGGTNFGNTAGGPYITTSYDYDAPIDEYGNLNQPKWGHLKNLHQTLYLMEENLLYGDRESTKHEKNIWVAIYTNQGKRSCFFSNFDFEDKTFEFENNHYFVPGWSVTLLPDCTQEVYNTAKVNVETTTMKYVPNHLDSDETNIYMLNWEWTKEQVVHINRNEGVDGSKSIASNTFLDQKIATNGTNDYLWIMTNYFHNDSEPHWNSSSNIYLNVQTDGHVLHAFVNDEHVGSQVAKYSHYKFDFEIKITLKHGFNRIAFVSATVGLPNFGAFFDTWGAGITGPVKLISKTAQGQNELASRDISKSNWGYWLYKTGLHGEDAGYHLPQPHRFHQWFNNKHSHHQPFTWYKTNFVTPGGTDPVVVDLTGMGKGVAWVNGINIGRYWPQYLADDNGCDVVCDYRGNYHSGKCNRGCGEPTQKHYHIPRDWLKPEGNQLVLFEELGGNTQNVQIQTVTIGKICAHAYEGNSLTLACQGGHRIKQITFASFGEINGMCGFWTPGTCNNAGAIEIVKRACLKQKKCTIDVSERTFGSMRCNPTPYLNNRLVVEAIC